MEAGEFENIGRVFTSTGKFSEISSLDQLPMLVAFSHPSETGIRSSLFDELGTSEDRLDDLVSRCYCLHFCGKRVDAVAEPPSGC